MDPLERQGGTYIIIDNLTQVDYRAVDLDILLEFSLHGDGNIFKASVARHAYASLQSGADSQAIPEILRLDIHSDIPVKNFRALEGTEEIPFGSEAEAADTVGQTTYLYFKGLQR